MILFFFSFCVVLFVIIAFKYTKSMPEIRFFHQVRREWCALILIKYRYFTTASSSQYTLHLLELKWAQVYLPVSVCAYSFHNVSGLGIVLFFDKTIEWLKRQSNMNLYRISRAKYILASKDQALHIQIHRIAWFTVLMIDDVTMELSINE